MTTSCLFGIFVFAADSTLTYRFLTDDLFTYLYKRFLERGFFGGNNAENEEIGFSVDDAINVHFAPLRGVYAQTCFRKHPLKRITLESNTQIFFDQIGTNKVICMTDESFNTLVVLKTLNLFKSLIKFHLGAFQFTKSPTVNKLIDRISAALQYYLNNITTNQSLLFESSEYLLLNDSIRQRCIDACGFINPSIQLSSTTILITCKDKIVHMQLSNEQNRPSNSDIFLLLLNNTSRLFRTQFQSPENNSSNAIAHIYKTDFDNNIIINQNMRNSATGLPEAVNIPPARRTISLPSIPQLASTQSNDNHCIEVIFMKTSNKVLAPFTMYTIPLINDTSIIILVEWKNSLACSGLFELIGQLNLCANQLQFSYKKLNNQVKFMETNPTVRRYFESRTMPLNTLSRILNETHSTYKSLPKKTDAIDEENDKGNQILTNLTDMSDITTDIFHKSFFPSDDYANLNILSMNEKTILETPTIKSLQNRLLKQLADCFSFFQTKSQGNITVSFCQRDFPGIVHFALIDRARGRICTPVLFTEEYKHYLSTNSNPNETEYIKEKRIIAFELECLSALQRGCTSYTMTDEYFTYNYTLRLQESNGASMRLHKPFVKSEPPGVLHYDFYEKLAHENYAMIGDQTSIECFELICVHLRFVPPNIVREHCEQLWPKLMELHE